MEINVASLHLRARVVFSSEDERRRWTSVFAVTQKKLKKQLPVQAQEATVTVTATATQIARGALGESELHISSQAES